MKRALIWIALLATSPAHARSGEVMVAARLGALVPEAFSSLGASFLAGLEAGWVAPVWKKRLILAIDLGFGMPEADGQFSSDQTSSPVHWHSALREISVGISLIVRQPFGRLVPYLGVGPRLLVVDGLVGGDAGARLPTTRQDSLALGFQLLPGLGLNLGGGQLFVEVPVALLWRVGAVPRPTGDFNPSTISVAAGYRVFF